ncbi:MAG: thiolase family protein [Acidobacteriota bacterium]
MSQSALVTDQPLLIDGCRTPFQRAGTGFRDLMSYELATAAIRGLLDRTSLAADAVDRVILGAIVHNPRATNVAREAALSAGISPTVPAVTMTAAGVSATVAISHGLDLIRTGQAEVVIAGGTDCLSDPPIGYRRAMRNKLLAGRRVRGFWPTLRFALSLRPWDFVPDIPDLTERTTGETMAQFTERLAEEMGIDRQTQDAYALDSHRRAAAARQRGDLGREIVGVEMADGAVEVDNGIRESTTMEQLSALRPSFDREKGTLTAGNASFLTDGAAVLLLMSPERARALGLAAKAVFRSSALTAHDPKSELLLGPVFAIPKALEACGLAWQDLDVVELHEAFAAQVLAVLELLPELPRDRLNAWGGSLALGNPFAPNGARLLTTAAHRLQAEKGRFAVIATCAGGGLGQAMVLERV